MNHKLIRMMEEAGFPFTPDTMYRMPEFENLVRLEREACAKLCDKDTNPNTDKYEPVSQYQSGCYITAEYLAAAIRARGQRGD